MSAGVMAPAFAFPERFASANSLTGVQKVAVLFMVLGDDTPAALTETLSVEEVEAIELEIARAGTIAAEIRDAVLEEWLHTMHAAGSLVDGGTEFARKILERQFGARRALEILTWMNGHVAAPAGTEQQQTGPDPSALALRLLDEHPQTIALVLSHLNPLQSAAILTELAPEIVAAVVNRMACIGEVSEEMLHLIESELGSDVDLDLGASLIVSGGPAGVAAVLNSLPSYMERELIETIAAEDPALAGEIKALMFGFEDLLTLDTGSMQRLLGEVELRQLALALTGASEDLRNTIAAALPAGLQSPLQDTLWTSGAAESYEIEAAQERILESMRRLEDGYGRGIAINGESRDVTRV